MLGDPTSRLRFATWFPALRLSGFYDLIPSDQPGNEAGMIANVLTAQTRPKDDPRALAEAAAAATAK